jgi:hypothetical protein
MLTKKLKVIDLVPMKDPVGGKGKKHTKAIDPDNIKERGDRFIVPPFYIP